MELFDAGYRLPIEIVAIRDFQSKHWVRDLEVEIRNVSAKPIYEVYIGLLLPDDKIGNLPLSVTLEYGRIELMNPDNRPLPEDKPIRPGETALLKVDEKLVRGYEHHLQNHNVPEEASYRVHMFIETINFGDGTGFINSGAPYPRDIRIRPRPQRYVRVPVSPE